MTSVGVCQVRNNEGSEWPSEVDTRNAARSCSLKEKEVAMFDVRE